MIERRRDEGPTYAELDEMSDYLWYAALDEIDADAVRWADRWMSWPKLALWVLRGAASWAVIGAIGFAVAHWIYFR